MKKLFSLLVLVLLAGISLTANAYDVTFMVDDKSKLNMKQASSSGRNTWTGASNFNPSITNNVPSATSPNQYLLFNDTNKISSLYVNGSKQSTTTSGIYTLYKLDLSKFTQPILIEIYTSSSTATYTYPLSTDIQMVGRI